MNQLMDNIQCSVNIDHENKIIILQGLATNDLTINFTNDVDFTEFVSTLTSLIDNSKRIELTNIETDADEKLKLIMETISGIIDKYNESISDIDLPIQENNFEKGDFPF
ncbi:MAG: hypothetical protein Q8T08_15460 [Ignavibacteria bacterium]|nr:hypothetical protein [Ignavibacteria bacterium]